MTLYLFFAVGLVVHLSLQHFFIPQLEAEGSGGPKTFKKSTSLAVLKYLSTTSLLASATYALIILLVFVLSLTRPVTSHELGAAIANIQWLQSKYKFFRELWTLWLFLILLLAYVVYRRDKKAAAREGERARAVPAAAVVESLPPNEEMDEIERQIGECATKAARLENSWVRSDEELAARKTELGREAERLQAQLREADERRRSCPTAPAEAMLPTQDPYPRLRRFFASKGFLKILESTTRSLGYAGTVLLVLCVIGVNVPVLNRALADRALSLSELQVEASKAEALSSFERVMVKEEDGGPRQLSEEDRQVIKEAARLFEQSFTSSKDLQKDKEDDEEDDVAFPTRSYLVRDLLVRDFRRKPPGGPNPPDDGPSGPPNGPNDHSPDRPSGPSGPPEQPWNTPGWDSDTHTEPGFSSPAPVPPHLPTPPGTTDGLRARLAGDDRVPQTRLGEQVAAALEKEMARKPGLLKKLRAKLKAFKASFSEPFDTTDLGKFAVGEVVGYAVDNSWEAPDEVAGQVKKVGQTALKDAGKNIFERVMRGGEGASEKSLGRMFRTLVRRYIVDVAGDGGLGAALKHVRDGVPNQPVLTGEESAALREVASVLPRDESLFAKLTDNYKKVPPSLAPSEPERAENEAAGEQLRKSLGRHAGQGLSNEELKSVDSYEDHYPGWFGSEAATPKGRLLVACGGKLPDAAESQKLLAQSRDFNKLKLSVDLGGILMGRGIEPSSPGADFRDMRWRMAGERVTIFLRRADGSEVSAGPFEKLLVHQALGFVADDRKAVVTIISGGSGRRRVMLHPALVDTQFGHDIVVFDKFVFRFMDRCDPVREQPEKMVNAQLGLYNVARSLRKLSALRRWESEGRLTDAGRKELNTHVAWENKALRSREIFELLKPALLDAEGLERLDGSILAWGKAFYDQSLVRDVVWCASEHRDDFSAVHRCLSTTFSQKAEDAPEETLKDWSKPAPKLGWRSIAEELPYQADGGLSFLNHPDSADPAESLWPFQFRYEIAFPENAAYRNADDPSDAYRTPWEFGGLRRHIAKKVWEGVETDAELRLLYKRVRDFTVLQRLFRTSLEGSLERRFPVEKLVPLMRATGVSSAAVYTPRWDDLPPRKCG